MIILIKASAIKNDLTNENLTFDHYLIKKTIFFELNALYYF